MKTIDLNHPVTDIRGSVVGTETLGQCIANLLFYATEGNKLKFNDWALKLYSGGVLELDKSDFDLLKSFITNNKNLYAFSEAQLLRAIGEYKD